MKTLATYMLAAGLAGVAQTATADQMALSIRDQRCATMQERVDAALGAETIHRDSAKVERLREKARALCAGGKQSQGVRAFAAALEVLGHPVDGSGR